MATDPWGSDIDNGWRDLVVSSAPVPPPPLPREALEPPPNRALPADLNTWQEHGAGRATPVPPPLEEPSFSAGDRRLWLVAGTLMGLAVLVLGVLALLTFGKLASLDDTVPPPLVIVPTAPLVPAQVAATEPPRAASTARPTAHTTRHMTKHERHQKHSGRR
jgi:hypothetical protein